MIVKQNSNIFQILRFNSLSFRLDFHLLSLSHATAVKVNCLCSFLRNLLGPLDCLCMINYRNRLAVPYSAVL